VDPVRVVKFYLGKLSECSGRDDILFSAMRAQGRKTAVLPKVASYNAVLSQFRQLLVWLVSLANLRVMGYTVLGEVQLQGQLTGVVMIIQWLNK